MRGLVLVLAVILGACGAGEEAAEANGGGGGGGGGAGGSGGGVPEVVYENIEWEQQDAFPTPIDHHVTFLATSAKGPHLYVAGGHTTGHSHGEVWMASLDEGGAIGEWTETAALPMAHAGHGLGVRGNKIYLTGGRDETLVSTTDDVYVGTLGDDGGIEGWVEGPSLPEPCFHHGSAIVDRWLYAVGGLTGSQAEAHVFRTEIQDDGTLAAWVEDRPLPETRSHATVVAHGGAIYVLGGLVGNPAGISAAKAEVFRAVVGEDGALGPWETLTSLPTPRTTASGFVAGGSLFVLGGVDGEDQFVPSVIRAPVAEDGTLGSWVELDPMPEGRAHVHQTPVHEGRVYSIGGSADGASKDHQWIGTLVGP